MYYDARHPEAQSFVLDVGGLTETVEVTAQGRSVDQIIAQQAKQNAAAESAPSVNIRDLQRRVSGVLPIRVDVPRAGNAFRFVRPLVLDEETHVSFHYKTK